MVSVLFPREAVKPAFPPQVASLLPAAPSSALALTSRLPCRVVKRFRRPKTRFDHEVIRQSGDDGDFRLMNQRRMRTGRLPKFKPEPRVLRERHESQLGEMLSDALKAGARKLIIEIALPALPAPPSPVTPGRAVVCKYIEVEAPAYETYQAIEVTGGCFYEAGPRCATKQEALDEVVRRRRHLKRGFTLNIMGFNPDTRCGYGEELLTYSVGRF